jgi:hypothetical protein
MLLQARLDFQSLIFYLVYKLLGFLFDSNKSSNSDSDMLFNHILNVYESKLKNRQKGGF